MRRVSIGFLTVGLAFMIGNAGCLVGRTMSAFEDHPSKSLTLMETVDTYAIGTPDFHVYPSYVHQFWQCVDSGSELACKKVCGQSEIQCPMVVPTGK